MQPRAGALGTPVDLNEPLGRTAPVCGMMADPASAPSLVHDGRTFYFCKEGCKSTFAADPERYLTVAADQH
jgi:Cu+-exporting ATPase